MVDSCRGVSSLFSIPRSLYSFSATAGASCSSPLGEFHIPKFLRPTLSFLFAVIPMLSVYIKNFTRRNFWMITPVLLSRKSLILDVHMVTKLMHPQDGLVACRSLCWSDSVYSQVRFLTKATRMTFVSFCLDT